MAKIMNPTKVITGVKTRWSYANVWQAKSINGGMILSRTVDKFLTRE